MEARLKSDTRATELRRGRLERTAFVLLTLCLAGDAASQTSSARLFITPLQVQPPRALAPSVLREARVRLDDSLLGSAAFPAASRDLTAIVRGRCLHRHSQAHCTHGLGPIVGGHVG